jgi:hypothetical protein
MEYRAIHKWTEWVFHTYLREGGGRRLEDLDELANAARLEDGLAQHPLGQPALELLALLQPAVAGLERRRREFGGWYPRFSFPDNKSVPRENRHDLNRQTNSLSNMVVGDFKMNIWVENVG